MTPGCPSADTLTRLLEERLPAGPRAGVEEHVEHCPACQDALGRLSEAAPGLVAFAGRPESRTQGVDACPGFVDALVRSRPADPDPDGLPDVPGYEILGELGRGGMGVVYRAVQRELNRQVALKMVAGPHLSAQTARRLWHEARAIARLRHPNIVQVYDVGEQAGRPYFSLELVEGGNLAQWAGGRPQPPAVAAQVVERLAHAVDYAHRNGIVHRDLKPANVLVPAGEDLSSGDGLKITDFGLAKEDLAGGGLTASGATLGTPSYMAPEQATGGAEAVGPPADIYALGAILYELLTGRPPFRAATSLETLVQVVHDEPVSVTRLRPRVPRDLATVCQKCLEKGPRRRYGTAAELADDLRRFLDHEPIRARRIGAAGRLVRWARRNPVVATLTGVLAAVSVVAFTAVLQQWQAATRAADAEAAARAAAQKERDLAAGSRRQAEQASLRLLLDRGLALCEAREVGPGLLWLARGLEQAARVGATDLEPVFRANLAMWADRLVTARESPDLGGPVTGVAFRRDGRQVAAVTAGRPGEFAGRLTVMDADTWAPVFPSVPLGGAGAAVAYSPDGGTLMALAVTGPAESVVRFWSADDGKPRDASVRVGGRMAAAAYSPDGKWVAVGGGDSSRDGGSARVWDAATGKPVGPAVPHPGAVQAVVFSPDGSSLATGSRTGRGDAVEVRSGGELRVWDPSTGALRRPPAAHTDAVSAVAFHPGGRVLLTGCADTLGRYWTTDSGDRFGPLLSHPCPVLAVALNEDGRTALTAGGTAARLGGGQDGAWLWNVTTGACLAGPLPHPDVVNAAVFRPGGGVATGCRDGRVRVWSFGDLQPWVEVQRQFPFERVAFGSDGTRVLTVCRSVRGESAAEVWDARTGQQLSRVLPGGRADRWAFAPDGRSGAAVVRTPPRQRDRNSLLFFDTASAAFQVAQLPAPAPAVLEYGPGGRLVACGGQDGSVQLWDGIERRALPGPGSGHAGGVTALAVGPNGDTVASGDKDGGVRLWNVRTSASLSAPPAGERGVSVLRFDPTGRTLLVATEDGVVRFWQVPEGRLSATALVHDPGEGVRAADFDPTGRYVCTASAPVGREWATVHVWDVRTGGTVSPPLPGRSAATGHSFHPSGHFLAVGGWDGNARLWDVATGRPVGPPFTHTGAVAAVALDASGSRLATAGRDGLLRIWPLQSPVSGSPAEVREWAERITGAELTDNGWTSPKKTTPTEAIRTQ